MEDEYYETWGEIAGREQQEEDSRIEEQYGSECVSCGQSIYNHDNDTCNAINA